MSLNGFQKFATHLAYNAQRQMQHEMQDVCHELGEAVKLQAEAMIGQYQGAIGPYPAWAALKQSTLERKARNKPPLGKNGPDTPLYATGKFAASIKFKVDKKRLAVHIGTNVPYIVWTELGTAKMEPRPVFGPAGLHVTPRFLNRIAAGTAASFCGVGGFNLYSWPQGGTMGNTGNHIIQ